MWKFRWELFKSSTWPGWKKGLKFFVVCLVVAFFLNFSSTGEVDDHCDPEPMFGGCSSGRSFKGDWSDVLFKGVGLYIFGIFSQIILNDLEKTKEYGT